LLYANLNESHSRAVLHLLFNNAL